MALGGSHASGVVGGSIASSVHKRKGSPCQQDVDDGDSQARIADLLEDIWHHIHSLMPLRDAACAACLSRAFLCSWRCHPNLTLNRDVLLSEEHADVVNVSHIIDRILRNHSGTGLKILKLQLYGIANDYCLDSWLQVAVTPTVEELTVVLCNMFKKKYKFPCSVLSNGNGSSIRHLQLGLCAFRPTAELGPLRNLTGLILRSVRVTGDELECFLSNSLALEKLDLSSCNEIICLKIPRVLQKFRCLRLLGCERLREIESKAPNLSSLRFDGNVKLSLLGETLLQMKRLSILRQKVVYYARAELPSIMPNLETLEIRSNIEVVNTPLLPTKFLYLKHLSISITSGGSFSPSYDYVSLVSFLDGSPSLETLVLNVSQQIMEHKSVFGDSSGLRQMPEQRHCYLRSVKMTGFSSAKSLVELTCYIVKNAVSLECLVLDTLYGFRCSGEDSRITRCDSMSKSVLKEATRAVTSIRVYFEDIIPNTVKLTVLEPCTRCHAVGRR
ncbi:unnamed protein product [Urochloa decumbens]|uniref:At1g61320/AtMIF1 LRR domain-containing protein n=1 Tax=Urochloa decumbens TaxID=240449 RepID=A0ABC9BZE5_9POAL